MDVYGKITKPFWDDKPVAIVGGGPSLVGFDFERLRGCHVLAVKGCIFSIPWADAGFGLGIARYAEWHDKLASVQSRVYWAIPEGQLADVGLPPSKNVTVIKRLDGHQVSEDPSAVYDGGTSGFGAFQVAILKRAKSIVLFGFDYDGEGASGKWRVWAEHFRAYVPVVASAGISVVNACPTSAIPCFQKVTLDDGVAAVR